MAGRGGVRDAVVIVVALCLLVSAPGTAFAAVGDPDTSFDVDGIRTLDLGSASDVGWAVALLASGKIVVAGTTVGSASGTEDFAVARFHSNGALDTSFGDHGRRIVGFESGGLASDDFSFAMAVQSDGKIVVGGMTMANDGSFVRDLALIRLKKGGDLDATFGVGGRVITDVAGGSDNARAIAFQPDGKIVVGGKAGDYALVARYGTGGVLDGTFAGDGTREFRFGRFENDANGVALQPDGKIVVAGTKEGANFDFGVARLKPGGGLDSTFSGDGKVVTDVSSTDRSWESSRGLFR